MNENKKAYHVIETNLSKESEIGRGLWMIRDTRQRTMKELTGLSSEMIEWLPEIKQSSIGTVLYHLAAIEADWLYVEVLEQAFPPEVKALFPYDLRDEQGHLFQVREVSLEQHVRRLETVRELLLDVYKQMDLQDFRRVRSFANYDVTPEWILHHLMQHEAEHRGQIGALKEYYGLITR
jgi:uncharacterized damage-inducible protein DinB